nr:DUF4395 domain-containing protein [Micromonospora sp. DSM 115978]
MAEHRESGDSSKSSEWRGPPSTLTWIGLALAPHTLENHLRSTSMGSCPLRAHVDPRLLRFSAGATASVLAVALLLVDVSRPLGLGLLASQVAVFAFTAFVSFHWSVWAQIFARVIWPRIGTPVELEDARPPRFAQFVGFVFTALALITFALGIDVAGYSLTAVAFGVTALNASTGLCLGCKAYHLIRRPKPA